MRLTSKFQRRNKTANFALLEWGDLAKDTFLPHMNYDNVNALKDSWGDAALQADHVTDYLQNSADNPRFIPDTLSKMRYGLEQPVRMVQRIGNAGRDVHDAGYNVGRHIGTGIHTARTAADNVGAGIDNIGSTLGSLSTGIQERMNGISTSNALTLPVNADATSRAIDKLAAHADKYAPYVPKPSSGIPFGPYMRSLPMGYPETNPHALRDIGDASLKGLETGVELGVGVNVGGRLGAKLGQAAKRRGSKRGQ